MIKNSTSQVPPDRSISHIERFLVAHGAKNIMKVYDPEGHLSGMAFIISIRGKG
jgi:hypothetical protein